MFIHNMFSWRKKKNIHLYTIFTLCIWTDRPKQNGADPGSAASHQGLHCLQLIQQFLDTTTGSKLYLFKF